MKSKDWNRDVKKLKKIYQNAGITYCENCGDRFALGFHHLIRRSKGGTNDPSNIILLCGNCHHKADNASGYVEFNNYLKELKANLENKGMTPKGTL